MVTRSEARKMALALPKAKEADHHGRPSFRVEGKVFATFWDEATMNVMVDEPRVMLAAQRAPRACQPFHWGSRIPAVNVRLSEVDPQTLQDLLSAAWARKAPRSLREGPR
jgi:hypothetical protein